MHITYLFEDDRSDPDTWSGTPYCMRKNLASDDTIIHDITITATQKLMPPLQELVFRCKKWWAKWYQQAQLPPDLFTPRAKHIATFLKSYLRELKTDVLLSPSPFPIAYLDTTTPIVYWTDCVYSSLIGFYPDYRCHHPDTMWDGHLLTNNALFNAKLLLFSSDWAARSAIELHGISPNKIKVVPFGANIETSHSYDDIKNIIRTRKDDCIKLLFVGKNWYRKGGDIAVKIAKALHESGYPVKLTLIGSEPNEKNLPSYIECIGKLSKKNKNDLNKLEQLYRESHFFFMPSRAECCAIALAEANAFGLPCLTTHVGGIPTAIKNNINGMMFSLDATTEDCCNYITQLMHDKNAYTSLALSSFNEYQTRLNWKTATQQAKAYITEIL